MKPGFIIPLIFILLSCSAPEKEENVQEDTAESSELTIDERKKSGDTIAFSPDVLKKALPSSVAGFTKAGPVEKSEEKNPGSNWSSVTQIYQKDGKVILVNISDFNGAYGLFAGATAIFTTGEKIQNNEEVSMPYTTNAGFKGWENFNKESGEGSIIITMKDRYLITIKSDNLEGTDLLKSFAEAVDINSIK